MRRRPDVQVYLRPPKGVPGANLEAEIVLTSSADTPTEGIDIDLEGTEAVIIPAGNHSQQITKTHLAKRASFPARTLTKGEHRVAVRFEIPKDAPATYSRHAGIHYVLEVHVRIPWWLDRHARFEVPVRPSPRALLPPRPMVYSTHPDGAKAKEIVIETSLDRQELTPGSVLGGAVAISNVGSHTIKKVQLELVAFEEPNAMWSKRSAWSSTLPSHEALRYGYLLVEGAPGEATPHRFSLRIPEDAPPTFDAYYFSLRWYLRVRVEVRWGSDPSLMAPITIAASEASSSGKELVGRPAAAPPVGRERRALVWAAVATRFHLQNDAEGERMEGRVGGVSLALALEQRGDGLHCIAALSWPALGLDLELHERGWTEALKVGEASLSEVEGAEPFAKRLALYGRDRARTAGLFADAVTRQALLHFDEVHVDDEGAALASRNAANGVDELGAFVAAGLDAARAFDLVIERRLAPPPSMVDALDSWRALAGRIGGRLELGRMWIHDVQIRGERGEVGTRWGKDDALLDSVVRLCPEPGLASGLDVADPELDPQLRALVEELGKDTLSLRVGPEDIEAILPAPLSDMSLVESILERMSQISRALRTGRDLGPYR